MTPNDTKQSAGQGSINSTSTPAEYEYKMGYSDSSDNLLCYIMTVLQHQLNLWPPLKGRRNIWDLKSTIWQCCSRTSIRELLVFCFFMALLYIQSNLWQNIENKKWRLISNYFWISFWHWHVIINMGKKIEEASHKYILIFSSTWKPLCV